MNNSGGNRDKLFNGNWETIFKSTIGALALFMPFAMAWFTWATVQIFEIRSDVRVFMSAGPRYTPSDARVDNLELKNTIMAEVNKQLKDHDDRLSTLEGRK